MKNLETYEESCEYHVQPQRIFKTFVTDVHETDQIFQTVVCYPLELDGEVLDVEIKMPLYVTPCGIRDDVEAALWSEYRLTLGNLKFELAPTNETIHP